ncbi:ASKHA domain-containing protein [Ignisphaera sp. 4213-co]|uniref:ASKHA domain-containing protein n=1 Tax=Ignisphaera cupida TaxID=3050454 RepID=A0ABD4Z640_9CREN|nr:ASKHA domain-containing protein [Ignisphaera sp. 4213-co]MDK6028771.1 ASKHA domain-containing protein [Ignisphaera sp. 4213-co]
MAVKASKGSTILDVARKANIGIRSVCGGKGLCGKCKVLVKGGVEHRLADKSIISDEEIGKGYVLACLAKVVGDVEVFIPSESQFGKAKLLSYVNLPKIEVEPILNRITISDYFDIVKLSSFYRVDDDLIRKAEDFVERRGKAIAFVDPFHNAVVDVKESGVYYGVAVDVGTTKIVVALLNTQSGEVIDVESEFNKQMMYGEDIVSRISYATNDEKLKELQKAVVDVVNALVNDLCRKHGVDKKSIYHVSVAGNTAMTYLFVGANPHVLIQSFKQPVKISPKPYILRASDIGLDVNRNALVYVLPCSGRFLGGDVVGDIITAGLHLMDEPALLIDIGTNAEVVIGCRNWFLGTTAPAGPAFEGWGLRCGVRAVQGAIESVEIDSNTLKARYRVIGNVKPIGICGSGYIDLVAQLFINGVIDAQGKFYRDIESPYIRRGPDGYEYVVASAEESGTGRDIVITEKDIYNVIDSKSSVCAAISILMKRMHLDVHKIKHVFICGAFGRYLNIDSAIAIGMIPEFPNAEISFIGNGSLGGAILTTLSKSYVQAAENVAKNTASIELMLDPNFMEEYEAGFILPGKQELFPIWWRKSKEIKPWSHMRK